MSANYTYYANNNLHTLQNKKGSTILEAYQYVYDGAGNMTAKEDVKGTTVYTYTSNNQLATVTEPSGKLTEYTYDESGNRQSEVVTENKKSITTLYEVNEQNRLIYTEQTSIDQIVQEDYFYDNAGNMLGRRPIALGEANNAATSNLGLAILGQEPPIPAGSPPSEKEALTTALYRYNDKNQMVEAKTGASTVENTFNAEGLRNSKTVDDVTTWYCFEYNRVIKELDSEDSEAYNIYGTNLISRELDGDKVYYIFNGHGDVTGLLSSNGAIIATYYYDAFGEIVEESGNFGNPYRYAGYMFDSETELYNLNARFYDAKIARFMQEDTYLGNSADPLSLNLYTYCKQNPLVYFDPTGHDKLNTSQNNLTATQKALIQKTKDVITKISEAQSNIDSAYNAMMGGYISYDDYAKNVRLNGGTPVPDPRAGNNTGGGTGGDIDYIGIARELGISTASDYPYKDIIDCMLGTGGFTSFTGVPVNNGSSTLDYDSRTGKMTIKSGSNATKSTDMIITPSWFASESTNLGQSPTNVETFSLLNNLFNLTNNAVPSGIVIFGIGSQREQVLAELNKLTDHTLDVRENGQVYIKVEYKGTPKYPVGNMLIENLINSQYVTIINASYKGSGSEGGPIDSNDKNAYDGTGTNAIVVLDFKYESQKYTKLVNPLTNTVSRYPDVEYANTPEMIQFLKAQNPLYITLAHELIHAERTTRGVLVYKYETEPYSYTNSLGQVSTVWGEIVEEVKTIGLSEFYNPIITENAIRAEHELWLRGVY